MKVNTSPIKLKGLIRIRKFNLIHFRLWSHNKEDENSTESSLLLHKIVEILEEPRLEMAPPLFIFKPTLEAAEENLKVLKAHNCSLTTVLASFPHSPCSFGSEFRAVQTLEKIFKGHPLWKQLRDIVEKGASYPVVELDDTSRRKD